MQKRFILAITLALSCSMLQAGGLFKPKKLLLGAGALVAGAAVVNAAKKHCRTVVDIDTGQHRPQCDGVDAGALKERVEGATKSKNNDKLKKALNIELGATGEPPNPNGCEAHHIVPRGENRIWARQAANMSREAIESCVSIDSAENGVYLPAKDSAQCLGRRHRGLHTKNYYDSIAQRLNDARVLGGCGELRRELSLIKRELALGVHP